MNAKKLIFKEGLLNLVALFIAMCLNFLGTILLTKTFSLEYVGVFTAILYSTTIFSTITLVGINNIFIKQIPSISSNKEYEASDLFVYQLLKNIVVTFVCIVLIYIFKRSFINFFIKNEIIGSIFYVIPLYIVNTGLQQVFGNYLRAWYKSAVQTFIINTVLKSINFIIIIICLRFKLTFINYIHYYLFLLILINVMLFLVIMKSGYIHKFNLKIILKKFMTREKFIEIDIYGLIMALTAIASVLGVYSDRVLVNHFESNSKLAVYGTAFLIGSTIAVFGNAMAQITHPLMGKYLKENNVSELDSIYKFTQKWSLIATLPVAIVFIIYSKSLLGFLGTAKGSTSAYTSGAVVLSIIVIGQLINVGTGMCGGIISFSKYYKMDLYTQVILATLSICFDLAFIPVYGINGAAVASASSLAIYNIIKVIYVYRKYNILPFDSSILKVLAGTVASVFLTLLLNRAFNLKGVYILIEIGFVIMINYGVIVLCGLSKGDVYKLKSYFSARKV